MYGTSVTIEFKIKAKLIFSNSNVYENNGKVCICAGPFVCAGEGIDNIENLNSIFVDSEFKYNMEYDRELMGYKVDAKAYVIKTNDALYSQYKPSFEDYTLRLIPYASFANRKETNMLVWFNVK